jgi:formylglycine-generating enzyme required for sulfatase activity
VVAYERAAGPLGACLARQAPPQRAPSTGGMAFIRGGAFDMGARPLRPEEGPAHRTRVDSFWIDRTDVTNADFARFVAATGYVTLAERAPDPRLYPGVPASALKPSGLVFVGGQGRGDGPEGWWRVVPGADWRHPQGPGS